MGTGTHQDKPPADGGGREDTGYLHVADQVTSVKTFAEHQCNMGIYIQHTNPLK